MQLVNNKWEEIIMASLLFGFVGMVLLPALILSLILGKFINTKSEHDFREDSMKFTISSDSKWRENWFHLISMNTIKRLIPVATMFRRHDAQLSPTHLF